MIVKSDNGVWRIMVQPDSNEWLTRVVVTPHLRDALDALLSTGASSGMDSVQVSIPRDEGGSTATLLDKNGVPSSVGTLGGSALVAAQLVAVTIGYAFRRLSQEYGSLRYLTENGSSALNEAILLLQANLEKLGLRFEENQQSVLITLQLRPQRATA